MPRESEVFRVVTDWHRWLEQALKNRGIARAVTAHATWDFFFWLSVAFTLLAEAVDWHQLRNVTWFRRQLPGKARDFNWHNVIGSVRGASLHSRSVGNGHLVSLGKQPGLSLGWEKKRQCREV